MSATSIALGGALLGTAIGIGACASRELPVHGALDSSATAAPLPTLTPVLSSGFDPLTFGTGAAVATPTSSVAPGTTAPHHHHGD